MSSVVLKEDYSFLQSVLKREIGYDLAEGKEYLIENRLAPIAAFFEFPDLHALVAKLRSTRDPRISDAICEAMTTNETSFFRDGTPFKILKEATIPELLRARVGSKTIKVWCAACSTGQEPYSISMLLHDEFPQLRNWNLRIVATDVSEKALQGARDGPYSQFEVQRGVPDPGADATLQASGKVSGRSPTRSGAA